MSWCVCCSSVMRLGHDKDWGLIPGQNKFVFSSQRAHPASCITGRRDSFLEVRSWGEPVHCVPRTSSWHVSSSDTRNKFSFVEKEKLFFVPLSLGRPQWPRGLRRRSAAAGLLRLWFRIPPWAWIFVWCECCVCCQVEVSATSWSLVQRNPTDCCASLCVI